MIRILFLPLITILLIGCSNQSSDQQELPSNPSQQTIKQTTYQIMTTKLQEPWEIVKQDDVFYISERNGTIVEIRGDKQMKRPIRLQKELSNQSEAGLLGIAFPPDFTDTAFAYYSYVEDGKYWQRVITIKLLDDHWEESAVLLDRIPGGDYHQGGRLEIGPDQKLYITTGDATVPELAQDLNSLAGKILRMNLDGSIPEDNPFQNSYVYSYGHRNPQGLAWDEEGNLYETEHGSTAHDEINRIEKGKNYGWPIIQDDEKREGMQSPLIHSGEDTWAPSGMAYLDGKFYFASLRGEGVRVYDPATNKQRLIVSDVGRVRDVLATPEGLYAITNNTDGRGNPSEIDDILLYIPLEKINE